MGELALAWTQGLQKGSVDDEKLKNPYILVAATLKHFDANSLESSDNFTRHTVDAEIPIQLLTDYYWPAFQKPIAKADAKGVMCSYNSVNGVPACASATLKNAREAWNFTGYVTSDSDSVSDVFREHHYTEDGEEASCVSIHEGGTDIDSGNTYYDYLLKGVNATTGKSKFPCSMQDVDKALFHSFRVRFALGLFDKKQGNPWWKLNAAQDIGTASSDKVNKQAARESLVLLQNPIKATKSAVLPFSRTGLKVAVIGPHANASWALIQVDTGMICPDNTFSCVETPLEAITKLNAQHGGTTTYAEGCDVVLPSNDGFANALSIAQAADVIVLGLGITACGSWDTTTADGIIPEHLIKCERANETNGMQYVEAEGHDRISIDLPAVQRNLTRLLLNLGKPTAIFLLNGGMVAVEEEMHHPTNRPAIVEAFYPGAEGGGAIADALFGVSNSFGRMPYTVYHAIWTNTHSMLEHDVQKDERTYRYMKPGAPALFPFGHGQSYTTFDLTLTKAQGTLSSKNPDASLVLNVVVENSGTMVGDAVVLAYFVPARGCVRNAPVQSVWGFQRAHSIAPAARATLKFELSARKMQLADVDGAFVSCSGNYTIRFDVTGGGAAVTRTVRVRGGADKVVLEPYAGGGGGGQKTLDA